MLLGWVAPFVCIEPLYDSSGNVNWLPGLDDVNNI